VVRGCIRALSSLKAELFVAPPLFGNPATSPS
jgi:hypothetical protein